MAWVDFWALCSIPLIYMPILVPVPGSFENSGFVQRLRFLSFLQLSSIPLCQCMTAFLSFYHDFTHMWNLMRKMNKQNRDRLIDREQADTCQERLGGWGAEA